MLRLVCTHAHDLVQILLTLFKTRKNNITNKVTFPKENQNHQGKYVFQSKYDVKGLQEKSDK